MLKEIINKTPKKRWHPFVQENTTGVQIHEESQLEAVVVDVIVNDSHPKYAQDGYNVGAIKFKLLQTDLFREDAELNWALPVEANITDYPLLNEVVIVFRALNRLYYTRKISVSPRVNIQAMFGLKEELDPAANSGNTANNYEKSKGTPKKVTGTPSKVLGKYFTIMPNLYRLRHDEGDIIFEGRSGQSIRLGAAWKTGTSFQSLQTDQSPNILLRAGQNPNPTPSVNTPFGLVTEDINKDQTSLYLVSDQVIPLKYATEGKPEHKASISDFPARLDGNQLIINTGRIVLNAKGSKIMGHAASGVHWTSNTTFTVDTGTDYLSSIGGIAEITAKTRFSVISNQIYLGSKTDKRHPIPLGDLLAKFLSDFLDAHIQNAATYVQTAVGPGVLSPGVVSALTKLKTDVAKAAQASFNSIIVYGQ